MDSSAQFLVFADGRRKEFSLPQYVLDETFEYAERLCNADHTPRPNAAARLEVFKRETLAVHPNDALKAAAAAAGVHAGNLKVGQHVILKNLTSDEKLNGLSAYVIGLDSEFAHVITAPNRGKPIKVKKGKCEISAWKSFEFSPETYFQAFPLGMPAPPGLAVDMDISGERGYNLYKKMS